MQTLIDLVIAIAVVGALVVPAALFRTRLFPDKPERALAVLVAAAVIALALTVTIVRLRAAPSRDGGHDDLFGRVCATPAAGDDAAKAFHDLACSGDVRIADLRGANEYQGTWAHVVTRGDKLLIFTPRSELVSSLGGGKGYHLWLYNKSGDIVDHVALDRAMGKLMLAHAKLAEAVKAVVTIEVTMTQDGPARAPTKPSTQIVVQGTFAPM